MMNWCAFTCCVLWFVWVCTGLQCTSPQPAPSSSPSEVYVTRPGHWVAQVQLGHDSGQKDADPWEVDVEHTTAKCDDSESVHIVATATAPPSTPTNTTPGPQGIPTASGYELVPELGYYKLHTEVNTWHGALKICELEGAHLLVLNSEQEAKLMKPIWDKNPKITGGTHSNWAWVGFHDLYKEGEFVTIFNDTLKSAGYLKWGGGEGTGGISQNCGLFSNTLEFADYPCNTKDPFFCEKEL